MRKLVAVVLSVVLVILAGVATMLFISLNNHDNNTSDVRSTVVPTVVPTVVSATEAPEIPIATFAQVVTVATAPAAVATTAPAPVVTAHIQVSSLDVSKKTIVTDNDGNIKHMTISYGDLKKVDYEEVIINNWNGVALIVNNEGVIGEIFNRENKANNAQKTSKLGEETVKNFFINGLIKSNRVKEGYAVPNSQIKTYDITNIMFVQIFGEENYRLVIAGNSYTGGGNGGKADPTATAIPEATKEPGGNNNPNTPAPTKVLPTPEATKAPGGNNSGLSTPEATKEPIGGTEAGGSNSDISKVNSDNGNSRLNVTVETVSVSSNDSESTSDSSIESVEDLDGTNSALPAPEDF